MAGVLYASVYGQLFGAGINFASDTIKLALTTSTYTPDALTHDFFNDVTNEVAASGSYAAGGITVASKTTTLTVANNFGISRANSTAYAVGDFYRPATGNGWIYQCISAGTSAASPPTFTTVVGDDFADGTATFTNKGRAIFVIDFADPQATSFTGTARTAVLYKSTGTASTSPLIGYDTFTSDVTATNGTFTYQVDSDGFAVFFVE